MRVNQQNEFERSDLAQFYPGQTTKQTFFRRFFWKRFLEKKAKGMSSVVVEKLPKERENGGETAVSTGIVEEVDDDDVVQLPDYADPIPPLQTKGKRDFSRVLAASKEMKPLPLSAWTDLMSRIRRNVIHLERHLHDGSLIVASTVAAMQTGQRLEQIVRDNRAIAAEVFSDSSSSPSERYTDAPVFPPPSASSKFPTKEEKLAKDVENFSRSGVSFYRGAVVYPRQFDIGFDETTERDAIIFTVTIELPKIIDVVYDLDIYVHGLDGFDFLQGNAKFCICRNLFEKANFVWDSAKKCWRASMLRGGVSMIHVPFQEIELVVPLGMQYDLNDWKVLE